MTDTVAVDAALRTGAALPQELRRWRDAAVSGALPEPSREDRWQQLRAGVVNMWEFEVAEFWSADGRAQLMGRNETGKSTLMTLTTLIMLAGSTATHFIDTLGDGGKRFRYYVEPTESDKDRRDASKSVNRGWIWVEYGRWTPLGPRYATALLYAEAQRPKAGSPNLTWAVCEGPARVRDGLVLLRGSATVPPGDLAGLPGWHRCESGEAYRQRLSEIVFDGPDSALDSYVRMLRVIRTPKLGQKLDLDFLSQQIRLAFPPLHDREIHQLADGWDQLKRIAADRDSAQQAQETLRHFINRAWSPWARAVVRASADAVAAASNAVDDVVRRTRLQGEKLTDAQTKLGELGAADQADAERGGELRAEREEIRESATYRSAEGAQERARALSAEAEAVAGDAAELKAAAELLGGEAAELRAAAAAELHATQAHAKQIDDMASSLAQAAADAGLGQAACDAIISGDDARARVAHTARRDALEHLRGLLEQLASAQREAQSAANTAGLRAGEDKQAQRDLDRTVEQAAAERQRVVDEIGAWAATVPQPPPEGSLLQDWADAVDALPRQETPSPVLRQLIETGFLSPRRAKLTAVQAKAELAHESLVGRAEALGEEILRLREQTETAPPDPRGWARRVRPHSLGPDGAPLWRLLDPVENLPAPVLATLEAALDAAGLLDAWVTLDGVWSAERDGAETVITLPGRRPSRPTLADVLRPASDTAQLAVPAADFLASIAWSTDGTLPESGTAIAADGRWRTEIASGLAPAAADGASHIGAAARAAWRERRIGELTEQQSGLLKTAAERRAEADAAARELEDLAAATQHAPDDTTLVLLLRAIVPATTRKQDTAAALAKAQAKLDETESLVALARSAVTTWRDEHSLPQTSDQLDAFARLLENVSDRINTLRSERSALVGEQKAAALAATAAKRESDRAATEGRKAEALTARASELSVKARTARQALTSDAQRLLDRVQAIDGLLAGLQNAASKRATDRIAHTAAAAAATAALEGIAKERQDATAVRERATAAWWHTVDSNLPEALGIAEPPTRTPTAALESARAARAAITPQDWPDRDPDAQQARIHRTWRKLTEDSTELRSVLEASAGRTVRVVESETDTALPVIEVVIDSSGIGYGPREALLRLGQQHEDLQRGYDRAWEQTLNQLLGSTFIEHLRDRLATVHALEKSINDTLAAHPTGTTRTMLRIRRVPLDSDPHGAEVLAALSEDYTLLSAEVQEQVQFFLRSRVEEAQAQAQAVGESDWSERLSQALDYRRWFSVVIDSRTGTGRWSPLSRRAHEEQSGGARVVTLMLPLIAALAAMYQSTPTGPRPLWLDEAFDGVDAPNRASILGLLGEFDMDYLLAGPGPLVNTATVPSAAMYEVVRAPHPLPGADLTLMLWAAGRMEPIDLPDPALLAARAAADAAAAEATIEAEPDLFSVIDDADG